VLGTAEVPLWALIGVGVLWLVGWWLVGWWSMGRLIKVGREWGLRSRGWWLARWAWMFLLLGMIAGALWQKFAR